MKTDIRPISAELYFLPVTTRIPLKFGPETLTSVICARVRVTIADRTGHTAYGWGETPLSVQWVWPSSQSYQSRSDALQTFCRMLVRAFPDFNRYGHPLEVGHDFIEEVLPGLLKQLNAPRPIDQHMPWLAALVCCSPFDVALHDAFGNIHNIDTYSTYTPEFLNRDLSSFLSPAEDSVSFVRRFPSDFLNPKPPAVLPAWHLVGGMDLLDDSQRNGSEPDDGYPVTLPEWILNDGLFCLKVKLRGNDSAWDYDRLVRVGSIALAREVLWLSADFNCTVTDPAYVNNILDRLELDHARIFQSILYVEQPFPYDLETNRIDAHSVSQRKPLFMDESAHNWKLIRLGRSLGWTGVALKTCKTQSGALLSLCWAKAHGMRLMVQDLTNPMIAQIPHVRLAAHADTIMGVETNAMQFYPDASAPEAAVHPGLYRRRNGQIDLSSISGPGFGYRLPEMKRSLPAPSTPFP